MHIKKQQCKHCKDIARGDRLNKLDVRVLHVDTNANLNTLIPSHTKQKYPTINRNYQLIYFDV